MKENKFKIKNRKKRKYIKRSSPISELSLSKSWLIKFMPYIIMAVGLITTITISPPVPFQMQQLQGPDISLNQPTISFDYALRIFTEIAVYGNTVLGQIHKQIIDIVTAFSSIIMQGISSLVQIVSLIISAIISLGTALGKVITTIIMTVIDMLASVLLSVWQFIIQGIQELITIIQTIIKIIFEALTFAWNKIIQWLNSAWYFVTTPFRALVALFIKIKPYLDFVSNTVKESSLFLIESMSMVMGGIK